MRPIHNRYAALILGALLICAAAGCAPADKTATDGRLIAIGDLHGDLNATLEILRAAGAIDEAGDWCGADMTVVQTGDQLDRGDDEQAILDLLAKLEVQAREAGGRMIVLNGNHEIMNAELDLRYVTGGGFADFDGTAPVPAGDAELDSLAPDRRARAAAFRPGGPYALRMSGRPIILQIGGTVFVHGGVLPEHVDYGIERINREARDWLSGEAEKPAWIHTRRSPTWARNYSDDPDSCDCDTLSAVLAALGAERMVVGHTVQEDGIRSRCDGRVWCIDSGMSDAYGGPVQAVEIDGPDVRVIEPGPADVRAQRDTIGFAVDPRDMAAVIEASGGSAAEPAEPWNAVILPHDDYLYAGPTVAAALPGLRARTWLVIGVCHACRRIGVRDRIIFDDFDAWNVAGERIPVDRILRHRLLRALDPDVFTVDRERHAAEHSIEALLPWLQAAAPGSRFVPVLVSGMEPDGIRTAAGRMADALAEICRENGWRPGTDVAVAISADAVHYGCDGWGDRAYHPFGCDADGHRRAVEQDRRLMRDVLAGPLDQATVRRFIDAVWDPSHPDYPDYPYKITWCGLYSIPFGLTLAGDLQAALGRPALRGAVIRYGDSVSDGKLDLPGIRLGTTAPNTLGHWVGYPAVGYRE